MGPLYHLKDPADRVKSLAEVRRVLRPSGVLFGVIIPRWASTFVGMLRGWIYDDHYASMVREEITTGAHVRPACWPQLFVDGFFHSVDDLQSEVRDAGLAIEHLAAIEGPAWMSQDFDTAWQDPKRRERILEIARLAETDPAALATSPHIAFICRAGSA